MKRLTILAAAAAISALALTGGASAKSVQMSAQEKELCRVLELAHETSCSEYGERLAGGRNWVKAFLNATDIDQVTGGIATDRAAPQSLVQ
jgi:hypothetical protein